MTTADQALKLPPLEPERYRIAEIERILTPALAIYPEIVEANLDFTLRLLGGDSSRWRPHVKTAKLGYVIRKYIERGVANFKCSTSLELATVCSQGDVDVLIAYPLVGANAQRTRDLADQHPGCKVSALVETPAQVEVWKGSRVGLFIDVNPGMDRTGIQQNGVADIVALARSIERSGQSFRGLHYYDGHLGNLALPEREPVAHAGYDKLLAIVSAIGAEGIRVAEVITAGTPAFPCTLSYSRFREPPFVHRASPGTVVYGDCSSLNQLPADWSYRPAAIVVSTVVSHPSPGRVTCDAGHKSVSADAGAPTCAVLGLPGLVPSKPSEEHLPIDVRDGTPQPGLGETLYLVPRHVCPTINNFDHALLVVDGRVVGVERVTARGREAPLRDKSTPKG
jgi:D-serine deaminase-like pyridoxal phosphate-dependent protein